VGCRGSGRGQAARIQGFSLDALLAPAPATLYTILQFSIGTNTLCIDGEDIRPLLPRFKPGRAIAVRCLNLPLELAQAIHQMSGSPDPAATRAVCFSIMKRIVRAGFELVMERERAFTRDLYFCYEAFARHYPERERDMWRALELAVDPSGDPAEVLAFVSDLGGWLVARTPEVFPQMG